MRRRFTALFPLLLLLPCALPAQDRLTGTWSGAVLLPAARLEVSVTLQQAAGAWSGSIDIPAQNARALPLTGIRAPGDSAIFTISGVPGEPTFLGVLAGDSISGDFRQGAGRFTFVLKRVTAQGGLQKLAGVDTLIASALRTFRVPGMGVGVIHRNQVIWSRGFGVRDVARNLPVTDHTLFAIGSATKAFTPFALGILADSGRFSFDRPARDYLPGLQLWDDFATARLTPRDMMTHRSGLPRHDLAWYNNTRLTREEMFERLRHFEPNRQLREQWQYNNMMFVLSGFMLGRIAGEPWEDAIRRLVLAPLQMDETNFSVTVSQRSDDHALPYRERGDSIVLVPFRNLDAVGPAGSINSNVDDMLNWVRVHLGLGRFEGNQVIQPATLRDLHSPHMIIPGIPLQPELAPAAYGLGWFVQQYRGHTRVAHGGNIDGFSALVTLFPREELGIVVLTNLNGTPLPDLVTNTIADRLLEEPARAWIAEAAVRRGVARTVNDAAQKRLAAERQQNTRPSHPLAAYAAEYEHPGYGVLRISQQGNRLAAQFNGIETPLEHWHYDVFNGLENPADPTFHNMKYLFTQDLRGRIDGVTVAFEPNVEPIRFARRPDAALRDPAVLATLAGTYTLNGATPVRVDRRGHDLTLEIPGQPVYALHPEQDYEFRLGELNGFRVRFVRNEKGEVKEMQLVQPNGVFVAVRR